MDKTFFQSVSVVLAALAFIGVCWWAFAPSRRKQFDDAAKLPFADESASPADETKPRSRGAEEDDNKVNSL